MDEDINFCTEQIGQVKKVPEFDYKNRLKVAGTPLKVLKINTQESCNNPMVKMEQITSSSYINMAYIRLYLEMSRIHGSFEQPDNAVFSEQKLSSIKRTVAAKTTESRVMSLSDQKADSLNEQSDCSEEKRKAAIVKQHTKKEEVNHNKKIKRPGDFLEESDSPQDQKPALNNNMKRLRKLKKNEQQAKDVKPTVRNRELEGLEIKYDRELMSEFDEGIDLNDSNKHSNDLGIYPNVYRVADCKRKLRIRRSYPLSAKMYVEEFQIKKEKNIQPSNNHGATIHKYSNSITKEVIPYANLMARFQEFEKNDSLNTSEASTSTRVHSNNLGKLNIKFTSVTNNNSSNYKNWHKWKIWISLIVEMEFCLESMLVIVV